tara:strand:+ start:5586 stop:6317 length:732 start_codon:yes stop_codon:yes gene_type:complete
MTVWAAGIGAAVSIGGSIFGASRAKKQRRKADRKAKRLNAEINHLENNRTKIVNPFEGITDLSGMASNLSAMASAPKMNLAVATQAAEMQAEEADMALANTLDTLAATGASAGGATALAQMALKSKQGISASIEQQEARNQETMEKSRIQGELRIQDIQMSEAKRMQDVQMSQAEKVQTAEAKGKEFMYREEDARDMQKLNRLSAQMAGQEQRSMAATQAGNAAIAGGISAVGNIASASVGEF